MASKIEYEIALDPTFTRSTPTSPVARDEMDETSFNAMLMGGLNEAKADHTRDASDVFADLRRKIQ